MSHHPAYTMAAFCGLGGIIGFTKTGSKPSLIAGVGVGILYAIAAYRIQNGLKGGYETALGASALLVASSAPRFVKGPVPKALTLTGSVALLYYGKQVRDFGWMA